ncbi:MAG TPA: efflux RND transporter periplasmic adaptor subunit, partial [Pirellulales bacterium]
VAQCPLHHPDVAQLKQVPNIAPEAFRQAERALVLRPRAENNSRCKLHERRIQFASAEAAEKVGIDIDVVRQRPIVEAVVANGEIRYDETRMARLASRVAGTAWRVYTQVGDRVREGDVLALVDAAEVGKAKASFLQAITHVRHETTNVDQLKPLVPGGTVSGRQFREAEAALEDAQIVLHGAVQALANLGFSVDAGEFSKASIDDISRHLRFLGLSDELLDRINTATSNLFPVKAPIDGVVVNRTLVAGEVVQTNSPLFSVADVEQMWLVLDVREEDVKFLSRGQRVLFRRASGGDGPEVEGSLSWISTAVDDQTRTVEVRAELPNAGGRLRANSFGTGRIVLREEGRAVVVPTEAIHWDGCCHVVFVRDKNYLNADAPKFFHIRKVRPGVKDSGGTEIIVGLLPGEVIAAKNSVVLEAQLLKGNLGAGCGCGAD